MDRYENIQQIAQNAGCAVKRQENLSRYTSFHIGGPADLWIETPSVRALSQLLSLCWEENLPWMVLGKGSNLLVPDEGVHGVVLHLCGDFETIHVEEPGLIRCGAAVSPVSYTHLDVYKRQRQPLPARNYPPAQMEKPNRWGDRRPF